MSLGYLRDVAYALLFSAAGEALVVSLAELSEHDVMNVLAMMRKEFNVDENFFEKHTRAARK